MYVDKPEIVFRHISFGCGKCIRVRIGGDADDYELQLDFYLITLQAECCCEKLKFTSIFFTRRFRFFLFSFSPNEQIEMKNSDMKILIMGYWW